MDVTLGLHSAVGQEVRVCNLASAVEPLTTISTSQRDYLRCYADVYLLSTAENQFVS